MDKRSFSYAMWATFYRVILRWQIYSGIITKSEADYWKVYFSKKMGNVLAGKH